MNRSAWIFFAVLAAGVFAIILVAMQRNVLPRQHFIPELDNPMQLAVYQAPAERAEAIRDALSSVLPAGPDGKPLGRVSLSGPGQLVVLAPTRVQHSIAKAIETLGGGAPAAAASVAPVRLRLWLVDALPGEAPLAADLAVVAEALDAARPALGAVRFTLADAFALQLNPDGSSANAGSGRGNRIQVVLRAAPNGVQARLDVLSENSASLETSTLLPFGKTLVLAELSAAPTPNHTPTRLILVRAEAVDAGS